MRNTQTQVGVISWRCRWTGHHSWRYAPGWRDSRTTPDEQVCARPRCAAYRVIVVPSQEEPTAHIASYRKADRTRIRRVSAWDWGQPAERDESGEFWFAERSIG